jgi:hypothetical protein
MGRNDKDLNFGGSSKLLSGLAHELKLHLTFIARQAEYTSQKEKKNLHEVEKAASDSLKLIDSYLLCARSEYGQHLLPLEPIGPGAILYEVCHQLSPATQSVTSRAVVDADYSEPIMGHKEALVTSLCSLAKLVASSVSKGTDKTKLHIVSHKRRGGDLFVGAFAKGFDATPTEIARSAELLGKSKMSLSNQDFTSGINLTIAGQLAYSMGGNLLATKYKGKGGIAIRVIKSEQLSIVG